MLRLHSIRLRPTSPCVQPRISGTSTFVVKLTNNRKNNLFLPLERSFTSSTQTWHLSQRPTRFSILTKSEHLIVQKLQTIFVQKNLAHTNTKDEQHHNNKRKTQHVDPMSSTSELLKWLLEGNRWMYVAAGPTLYVIILLLLLHFLLEDKKQERQEVLAFRKEMEKDGPEDFKKRVHDEDFYQKVFISVASVGALLAIPLTTHLRHRKTMFKQSNVQETVALARETLLYVGIPNAFAAPFVFAVNKKHRSKDYLSMWNGFWTGVFTALVTHAIVVPYWMLLIPEREIKSKALSAWLNQTSIVIHKFMLSSRRPPAKTYLGASTFLLAILGPFTIPFNGFICSLLSLTFQKTHLRPWKEQLTKRKEAVAEEEKTKEKLQDDQTLTTANIEQSPEALVTPEKAQQGAKLGAQEDTLIQPRQEQKQGDQSQTRTQSGSERKENSPSANEESSKSQNTQGPNQTQVVDMDTTQPQK